MITDKILSFFGEYYPEIKAKKIMVALSGGADSVVLLHALKSLEKTLEIKVSACHFNHLIRGEEAERDENFARKFCEGLGVEFICGRADVPKFAKENGMSLELAARKLRYEFLENADGTSLIATAHTASDNLETVLFNLTRGTGLDGLCGIPPVRGRFIRPLIGASRKEIEEYCLERNLSFVTDSTNLSDDYTRNRIRHLVVPELKKINPAVETAVSRTASVLTEETAVLKAQAHKYLKENAGDGGLGITGFSDIAPAAAKRVLKIYGENFGLDLDYFHINEIYVAVNNKKRISVGGGYFAVFEGDFLKFSKCEPSETRFSAEFFEETVNFSKKPLKIHNLLLNDAVDCDKIVGKPYFRTKITGDTFVLRKNGGTKTIKKLFTEFKIPICDRKNLPLLCDDKGIIWICGIGPAERVKITAKTKKVLRIEVLRS